MKRKDQIKPLPYWAYYLTVLALSIAGLLVSVYLAVSHYRNYSDLDYQSFCAISQAINCDTVSQSAYSILFRLPVPIWGVIGYAFLSMIMIFAWRSSASEARVWSIIFWMALGFAFVSLGLAAVSTFLIHSYCMMCIAIYLVSFFTLWFSWLIRRRFATQGLISDTIADLKFLRQRQRLLIPLLSVFVVVILLLWVFMPPYWLMKPPHLSQKITSGLTPEGYPWIGAVNPKIKIEMYSDYQCFQCRKLHFYLRHLIARKPDSIQIIHRHFPMDHEVNPIVKQPFHSGSGKMALLAIFAASKGKFFEMNDLLFDLAARQKNINIKWLAAKTDLAYDDLIRSLKDPGNRRKLSRDIWQGLKLQLSGTPSFVINNTVYAGQLPAEVLQE